MKEFYWGFIRMGLWFISALLVILILRLLFKVIGGI